MAHQIPADGFQECRLAHSRGALDNQELALALRELLNGIGNAGKLNPPSGDPFSLELIQCGLIENDLGPNFCRMGQTVSAFFFWRNRGRYRLSG